MSLWTQAGNTTGAPKTPNLVMSNRANGAVLFGNTLVGSFMGNAVFGVFSANSIQTGANNPHIAHAGWQKVMHGTGPITGTFTIANSGVHYAPSDFLTISGGGALTNATANLVLANTGPINSLAVAVGGTLYNNTDTGKISGGTVNATFTLVTNSTGGLTSATLGAGALAGNGFPNTSVLVVAIANATGGATTGSGATFTITVNTAPGYITGFSNVAPGAGFINSTGLSYAFTNSTAGSTNGASASVSVTLGGRAGRVQAETLVAMSSCNNGVTGANTIPADV